MTDAQDILQRSVGELLRRRSLQWTVTLTVDEGVAESVAPAELQGSSLVRWFSPGTRELEVQTRGPSRLHWKEGPEPTRGLEPREHWYEGIDLYSRSGNAGPLEKKPFYEEEGVCLARSLVVGGLLGWQLSHLFDVRLVPGKVNLLREEVLEGRPAFVIAHEIKIGGICGVYKTLPGCVVWIDRERLVPLRRDYALLLHLEGKTVNLRATERFTAWRIDEEIPNGVFHTEGMGAADPLGDLPQDPAAFEKLQTEKALGVPVKPFPGPQGSGGYDEIPRDAEPLEFDLEEVALTAAGPSPEATYEPVRRMAAPLPDGTLLEGYLGRARSTGEPGAQVAGEEDGEEEDEEDETSVIPDFDPRFRATRLERRHRSEPLGLNVYLCQRVKGRLKTRLFFPDVASHAPSPYHFAVDSAGHAHLVVADIDRGNGSRFKLYAAVGDPASGRWLEAWEVDLAADFTLAAGAWALASKDHVALLWTVTGARRENRGSRSGLYAAVQSLDGTWGRKLRLHAGEVEAARAAADAETGAILACWSTRAGVFIAARPSGGSWSGPSLLHPTLNEATQLQLLPLGNETFLVRTNVGAPREWHVRPRLR